MFELCIDSVCGDTLTTLSIVSGSWRAFVPRNSSTHVFSDVTYRSVFDYRSTSLLERAPIAYSFGHSTSRLKGLHERPRAELTLWRHLMTVIEFGWRGIFSRTQTNLATWSLAVFSFVTIVHIVDVFVTASLSFRTGTR